jgi:ABC-type glycerol-3-phosphate transport system substrate-binding protein
MRKITRKQKKWIAFASVVFVAIGGVVIWRLCQPANELDFSTSQNFWEKEKTETIPSVKEGLVPTDVVWTADPTITGNQVIEASSSTTSSFEVMVGAAGSYSLVFSFYVNSSGISDTYFALQINKKEVASKVAVRTLWSNAVSDFETDRNGNDIMPNQNKLSSFQTEPVRDYLNRLSYPLTFDFPSGTSTIDLTMTEGDLLIGPSYLETPTARESYADYLAEQPDGSAYDGDPITIECEKPVYKNDNSVIYEASKDVNCSPYDTYSLRLNTATMSKCDYGQELTYSFEAPQDGYYEVAANYSNGTADKAVFVRLSIDGSIPFGEVANYPLYANSAFEMESFGQAVEADKAPFKFHFSKGIHTLSLALDGAIYADITDELSSIGDSISALYLQLRTLSVQSGDTTREWTPDEDFPGVVDELSDYSARLKVLYSEVKDRNGSSILNEGNVYLYNAYSSLDGLLKEPQYLPNNNAELAEGSGSIQQALASASSYLLDGTISLDRLVIAAYGDSSIYDQKGQFYSWTEKIKSFFGSFGTSSASSDSSALDVWVNRPTMYIDLMQDMVDSTFTKDTGIKVNLERLSDEGKLILSAAAGSTPDVVLGLSNWLPYELGIRNLSLDLRTFSDYGEVIDRFAPGAMLPLVADDIGLGLPETQDFYVTYYRKDIFANAGLSVPSTWDEVVNLLPTLQRKGMNYYIPLSSSTSSKSLMDTAPFIQQNGASLWRKAADGSIVTDVDSDKGLTAIKMMTNLYLLYGMELQVNSFFDSFRNGSLPIGIASMDTYQKLQYAAPELAGKWDIALAPGITDGNGTVERWEPGSATSCLIMKNNKGNDKCWSFLKWWDSASVQSEFANNLRNIVGAEYIYIPANLEAFDDLALPAAHKDIIRKQWEWMAEYPRVPGWYMLERELSNAWNNIVLNGVNARTAIDDCVSLTNEEIARKMIQFGYLSKSGTLIKDYKFSTIEEIEGWQTSA